MLLTSLTIDFSPGNRSGGRHLELAHINTLRIGPTDAIEVFYLMPAVEATLYPSHGAATLQPTDASFEMSELLKFRSSKSASLKYPPGWVPPDYEPGDGLGDGFGVSLQLVTAADEEGAPCSPDLHYDALSNSVVADMAFTGLVRVSYTVPYFLVYLSRDQYQVKRKGNLIALYQGAMAEASFGEVRPKHPITVYSVVSEYLADQQGAWEVPPDWPDSNKYPGVRETDPLPDDTAYQQLERVHENAFLDPDGDLRIERYTVHWEEPYQGPLEDYHPVYKFDPGRTPPPGSDWEQAWKSINWESLYEAVRARYPGIQGTA
jgi:hypothetical protein